ncbi:MAG: hypothetical protein AB2421_03940 [Thermotaleaceae bacterium]
MVKLITGGKGTGKTKIMIEMANQCVSSGKGNVVFLDDDNRHMYDLNHHVRFISLHEYPVNDEKSFRGFLCGIIAADHDIEVIFIDGLLKIADLSMDKAYGIIADIETLSLNHRIDFILSIHCETDNLPQELQKYRVV